MTKCRPRAKTGAEIIALILYTITNSFHSHFGASENIDKINMAWSKHICMNARYQISTGPTSKASNRAGRAHVRVFTKEGIVLQDRYVTIGETGFCWYLNSTVRLDGQLMLP